MATYWNERGRKWTQIDDDVDLEAFALSKAEENEYQDSDNGWENWYEFWRDGIRTYAHVCYNAYDNRYNLCGEIYQFVYDEADEMMEYGMAPNPYSPDRDWIKVNM